nr:Cyclic AMP receptor protein [Cupriavidus sp.]
MTPEPDPIDRVLKDAAIRNTQIRAETQQAAIDLERLIQLVVGSDEIPEEFRPKLLAEQPTLPWSVSTDFAAGATAERGSSSDFAAGATPERGSSSDFAGGAAPEAPPSDFAPGAGSAPTDEGSVFSGGPGLRSPDNEEQVFSAAKIPAEGREGPGHAPPNAPPTPIDPQNLRPEDGGVALAYSAGAMLFSKGDAAELFFVITEGQVSLFEPTTGYEMAVIGPGDSLGEQSILMGGVHSLSARAVTRVVCTTVRADRLRTILDQQSGVVKPVFEAVLLQLSMHNELRAQGNRLSL